VVDREGRLLRAFTTKEGRWRLPVLLEELDPKLVEMLLVFEGQRCYEHLGVDVRALACSWAQVMVNGRIVSGGATTNMQLAQLIDGSSTRTASGTLQQFLAAPALERGMARKRSWPPS
jgi:penicillin-binding protein 1C